MMDGVGLFLSTLAIWKLHQKSQPLHLSNTQSSTRNFRVAIIGSGIGGLSVAISLQQEGIPFDIYERDCRLEDRREGFGLTLTCGKNGALDKLGVLEDCLSADCPSFCHWIFTPKGKILGYYGRALTDGVSRKNLNRSGNIRVPREALRRILMNKLKTEIKWNKKFVGCSFKKENLEEGLYVHFADGTVTRTDVLVGADGLHSRVRSVRDSNLFKNLLSETPDFLDTHPSPSGCENMKRYIGVTAILGITGASHPLISKQGFYILDGENRLFTMPYSLNADGSSKYCMWQLSFSGLTEGEALLLKNAGPIAQLKEALLRTHGTSFSFYITEAGWMHPVYDIIQLTESEDVWATPLYDRAPMTLRRSKAFNNQNLCPVSRITVIGDACHPMSMFKGQGANQALLDGPLLAAWLTKGGRQQSLSLCQRISNFEREMVARSSPKVLASYEASCRLHSSAILDETYTIEGADTNLSMKIIEQLEMEGIGAERAEELEALLIRIHKQILTLESKT